MACVEKEEEEIKNQQKLVSTRIPYSICWFFCAAVITSHWNYKWNKNIYFSLNFVELVFCVLLLPRLGHFHRFVYCGYYISQMERVSNKTTHTWRKNWWDKQHNAPNQPFANHHLLCWQNGMACWLLCGLFDTYARFRQFLFQRCKPLLRWLYSVKRLNAESEGGRRAHISTTTTNYTWKRELTSGWLNYAMVNGSNYYLENCYFVLRVALNRIARRTIDKCER